MAAMAQPFTFSESKLTPPSPRRLVVDRPRLVRALRDGITRRLVVVTAQAGYGKTLSVAKSRPKDKGLISQP